MDKACQSYRMLLSAYADGEVSAKERGQVELHLSSCPDCRARLADLKALSASVGSHLRSQAEAADFSGFADAVMRKITPERPSLTERLRIGWQEILTYHRTAVVSSLVTAAVTLAIAVPLVYRLAESSAPSPEMIVKSLRLEDPNVQPVVMNMGDGRTLIMLVNRPESEGSSEPVDLGGKPPSGGEL